MVPYQPLILFDDFIKYVNIYHGNHSVHSNYLKLKADSLYVANAFKVIYLREVSTFFQIYLL